MSIYDSGDFVRLSAIFTNTANVTGDPTTVWLRWRQPNGVTGSALYGSGTAIVRLATGIYYLETSLGMIGTLWYRWVSTGVTAGAEESHLTIRTPRAG